MRTCKWTASPAFVPFFFFTILWFHFVVKIVNVADAASAGEAVVRHRTQWRGTPQMSSPVGEQSCLACSAFSNELNNIKPMKLKVGIPKKKGFNEFVGVYKDHSTKKTCATGFSIDMFCAALQSLTFKVEPEFVSFEKKDGESAGTYNDLLRNISVKYEAVVGDVTIMANRASWVDFTMSYADSSVYVLVPTKHGTRKNMWLFFQPLSWGLWLAIVMAFVFVGIVIGTIEIRSNVTNTDFSGPVLQQLGMMIWYPISMLVLPERRMVVSMWSKLVLVVWLYVAYIIMQSYTANFTTMLTIDQLRPFFNKEGNYSVGYQTDSFVKDFLIHQMNFTESRVRAYSTIKEYHKALSKGSVAAIFDELPYIKLFLRKYGSKYTVDGPILRTNGLGFAFPLNSFLVPLISRAILNVTDSTQMAEIEHKYFGRKQTSEVEISRIPQATPRLDAYNFIGLFIVMGSTSIACLLCSEIWQRFVEKVTSTGEVNATGDPPVIDNQGGQSPTTSTQGVDNVSIEEEGEQEEDDEEEDTVHSP